MKVLAVVVAIPFGWMLGVLLAFVVAGPNFGQLPILTVPVGMAAGILFALSSVSTPAKRTLIMITATVAIVVFAQVAIR